MSRTRQCPACHVQNPGDAMFCQECGDFLTKSDRFAIEKKIAQSHCAQCGHYNPIEKKKCESCGLELESQQSAMFRDEHGRLRLVQETPASLPRRFLSVLVVAASMGLAGRMLLEIFDGLGQDPLQLLKHPLALFLTGYLGIAALTAGQRGTKVTYKAHSVFALLLMAIFSIFMAFGGSVVAWEKISVGQVFLWVHTAGIVYCLLFLLRAEFLRSAMTGTFFLLGLWFLFPALKHSFAGDTYGQYLNHVGIFFQVPKWASPGLLGFNIFLPYVLLMMVARLGHQFSGANAYVVNNPTDQVVVRQFRRRQLRGTFNDLVVAMLLLAAGLKGLHEIRKFNLVTPALKVYSRLTR